MPRSKTETSSSDESNTSGISSTMQHLSHATTPEQGPDKTIQTMEARNGSLHEQSAEPEKDSSQRDEDCNSPPKLTEQSSELDAKQNLASLTNLTSEPFDANVMKIHMTERLKGENMFDLLGLDPEVYGSRNLKQMVVDVARLRVQEASSLLAYVDNLEMKLLHLQTQLKSQQEKEQAGTTSVLYPIDDCECLSCQNLRKAGTGPEETSKSTPEVTEVKLDHAPLKEAWKKEIKRMKRTKDRFGDTHDMDIDQDAGADYNRHNSRTGGPILTHFNRETLEDNTNQLEINSPLLIEALRNAIDCYAGDDFKALKGDTVTFDEPYMILFHNRQKIIDYAEKLQGEAKDHVMYLLDFLRQVLPDVSRKLDEIEQKSCTLIDYNTLWLLYRPPNDIVFTRVGQHWRAFRVAGLGGYKQQDNGVWSTLLLTKSYMTMDTSYDGLVSVEEQVGIANFDNEKSITELDYIPQGFLTDEAAVRQALHDRGNKYCNFRGKSSFLEYTGKVWVKTLETDAMRVIVDHSRKGSSVPSSSIEAPGALPGCDCRDCRRARGKVADKTEPEVASFQDVDAHLLLPHTISAFSLRKKEWRDVEITNLQPVVFEEEAFKKLVIKKPHRKLVTAMAKSFFGQNAGITDLVKGKGRGLIILLHGPPGTGKTLTAECVAESEQRPLYMITCGDLGTEPEVLELKIRSAFEDATRWGAVLLLDEADVFLQERDVRDLKRNALVSVFLREIEYFDGILFLTTNRPGLLDEAFQSRIHVTLHLEDLDAKSQLRIWCIFLEEQIRQKDELQKFFVALQPLINDEQLNGRQIRNTVRTATALAATENKKFAIEHVKTVLQVAKQFADYRKKLAGMEPRDRQAAMGFRGYQNGS